MVVCDKLYEKFLLISVSFSFSSSIILFIEYDKELLIWLFLLGAIFDFIWLNKFSSEISSSKLISSKSDIELIDAWDDVRELWLNWEPYILLFMSSFLEI